MIVGETFVSVHAVTADLEKEISAGAKNAATTAEKAATITPKVNAAGAKQELGALEQASTKAKTSLDSTGKSSGLLGTAMADLKTKLTGVASEGGAVTGELSSLGQASAAAGPEVLAVAAAVALATGATIISANKFESLADQVHKFSLISGASTEDSSRFVVALKSLGVSSDTVGAGLFRLGHQIQDGTDKLGAAGVQVARTSDGNVDLTQTFLNVADAVQKAGGDTEKSTIAFDAFGRQGVALLPVLEQGRVGLSRLFEEADKHHEILSEADIQAAIQYKVSVNDLGNAFTGLEVSLGRVSIPVVTGGLHLLNEATDAVNREIGGTINLLDRLGVHLGSSGHSAAEAAAEVADLASKAADLQGAILSAIDAQDAFDDSTNAVKSAQDAESDAAERVSTLRRQGAVDTKAVASAQDSLRSSTNSLQTAEDALAKAQQHLTDVQQGASPEDLEKANLRVSTTTNALARAEENLATLRKKRGTSALDISDAENAVEQATLDQSDATDALTTAQQQGLPGSQDYADAQDQVATASRGVTDAQAAQAKAAAELRSAQQPDITFAGQLRDAEDQLATAHQGVKDAIDKHLESGLKLSDATAAQKSAFDDDYMAVGYLTNELIGLGNEYGDLSALLAAIATGIPGTPGYKPSKAPVGLAVIPDASAFQSDNTTNTRDNAEGRAGGGPTNAEQWYRVNERGQEFFRSNSSGTVLPVGQGPRSGNGGVTQNVNVNVQGVTDPMAAAQLVGQQTGIALRTAPR